MMNGDVVKEGDYVLLWHSNSIRMVVKVRRGGVLSTVRGIIRMDDIIGKPYGTRIATNLGHTFYITRPNLPDILLKMPRVTQPIYPKDSSAIIILLNIKPGSRVLESGLGSGFAASIIATYISPHGQLVSVERNGKYISAARRTLRELGLSDIVDVVNADIFNMKLPSRYFDAALLDMGDPWRAIPVVADSIRHGGNIAVYVPTVNQVEKVIESLSRDFIDMRMIEVRWREWKTVPGEVRPNTWELSHTGFIIVAKMP